MQTANALLALSLGIANFSYVDRLKKRAPKNQEAPFVYAADFVRKHKSSRIFSTTEYAHEHRCRSPPLLKFRVMVYQISEESEGPLLYTRYFRKKDSSSGTSAAEWIEMSGKEYYRFVTAPENRNRYFVDMGDVVLECTKTEYKKFKAEDDHSGYILAQEEGWSTVSLSTLEQRELVNGEAAIVDLDQNVEEAAIQGFLSQELSKALRLLPAQDYWIIYELYLTKPRKTVRQLSLESNIPVMTLQNRKKRIIKALKKNLKI